MTNNEIFRSLLHLTGVGRDKKLTEHLFELGGIQASQSKIKAWRTELDNPRASHMPDEVLRGFLQGLFEYRDQQADKGVLVFHFPRNEV